MNIIKTLFTPPPNIRLPQDSEETFITAGKNFVKEHKYLIVFCIIELLFIYGVKIFSYNIGVDTDIFLAGSYYLNWKSIGRFGLVLLKWLSSACEWNMYGSNFCAALFLVLGAIFWCILFDKYSTRKSKWAYTAFCIFYISSFVWVESNYFSCMSAETSFNVMLCPLCIYFTWEGIKKQKKLQLLFSILLLTFMISIYQAIVVMFFDGILMIYLLQTEQEQLNSKQKNRAFLNIIFVTVIALFCYFIANVLITNLTFQTENSDYLTQQIGGNTDIKTSIIKIFTFLYNLFLGDIRLLDKIIDPIIENYANAGSAAVAVFHNINHYSCFLYLPALICYIKILSSNKNKSVFYWLSAFGILLCAIIFHIVGGGTAPARALYAFALTSGFLFYYIVSHLYNKKAIYIWTALIFLFGSMQMQRNSIIVASDQIRYEKDVWLCKEMAANIEQLCETEHLSNPQVYVAGAYDFNYGSHYASGEVCGNSCINFCSSYTNMEATSRALSFMKAHGYTYQSYKPDYKQNPNIDEIRNEVNYMPSFPNSGWIKSYKGIIIIKLSDLTFSLHDS